MHSVRHSPYGSVQACTDAARSPFSLMSGACAQAYRHAPAQPPVRTGRPWKVLATLGSVVLAVSLTVSLAGVAITALPL